MVTYNFFHKDDEFFVIIDGTAIPVTKEVFDEYKRGAYAIDYSNRKYNRWNQSLNQEFYQYIYNSPVCQWNGMEEHIVLWETLQEIMDNVSGNTQKILLLCLSGYNGKEIADIMGLSQPYISRIKQATRKKLMQ